MEVQSQLIAETLSALNSLELSAPVTVGNAGEGDEWITLTPSGGAEEAVYYNRRVLSGLELTFRCRSATPATAYDSLYALCNFLRCRQYPQYGEEYDWLNTAIVSYPQYDEEKSDPENTIYKAVVKCTVYF